MPSPHPHTPLTRRSLLAAGTGAALAVAAPARADGRGTAPGPRRPFGRHGSPADRADARTLYVHPRPGTGDFTRVQAAVDAVTGPDRTIVVAPGTYRETVRVGAAHSGLTLVGSSGDPRDVVIVYDNAAGTPKPGGGTHGTSGSASVTVEADGFTARAVTFANDWLRAEHPGTAGTQAVALKATGDRSAFFRCRFLGHQDTLYADSRTLAAFARHYYRDCYAEGDVDFVFGRATAVFEGCRFHALHRTDLPGAPFGYVFAPSTAAANLRGYLVTKSRFTSGAPDGYYKLARPWVPSSDPSARPMLTVRDSWLGAGIDAAVPYGTMASGHPWQDQRFAEYRNTGPGAAVADPAERPRLTPREAASATREKYLGDWWPYARRG